MPYIYKIPLYLDYIDLLQPDLVSFRPGLKTKRDDSYVSPFVFNVLSSRFEANQIGFGESVDPVGVQTYPIQEGKCYLFDDVDDMIEILAGSDPGRTISALDENGIVSADIDLSFVTDRYKIINKVTGNKKFWNIKIWENGVTPTPEQKESTELEAGLFCWLKSDEGSGDVSYDSSGNENHGAIVGADSIFHSTQSVYSFQNQKGFNGALNFDGIDDEIFCEPGNLFNFTTQSFSVSFWFRTTEDTNAIAFANNWYTTSGFLFDLNAISSGNLRFITYNGGVVRTEAIIAEAYNGKWHHCLGTFDGTNTKLYFNNVLKDTDSPGTLVGNSNKFVIGKQADDFNFLNGTVRDVRIYNKELSTQERTDLFNNLDVTDSLIGHWKLNEMSGFQAFDSSGNFNHCTINGASWHFIPRDESDIINDIRGKALDYKGRVGYNFKTVESHAGTFDGIDDYIDVTDASLRPSVISISAWFKTDTAAHQQIIWVSGDPASYATNNSQLRIETDSTIKFFGRTNGIFSQTSGTYTDNKWHHVVAVADGTDYKIYVDGVQDGTIPLGVIGTDDTTGEKIGRNTGAPFEGQICDVRVFDTALTSAQINEIYNKALDVLPSNILGWWPIAEGDGSKAYDVSGNDIHGDITLTTPAAFWANKQDKVDYNLLKGFEYFDDDATHTDIIRVPYKINGEEITPTISGYSKISTNPAAYWHNNAETKLEAYLAPELIQYDIADGNNFLFNAGKTAANKIGYSDIVADVGGDGNFFADVSITNQKKNLRLHK